MKRIVEGHQDTFFSRIENVQAYLDNLKASPKTRYLNFLSTLKKLNIKGRYLDVGSGPGVVVKMVAEQHPEATITGIDVSEEMVKIAYNDLTQDELKRIDYKIADACDKQTLEGIGTFDLIYSTLTMHHWEDADVAIKNLYSLLNKNGILFLYDLKRVPWLYYSCKQNGFFKSIRASFRPGELKKILQNLGIKNHQIKTIFPFFMLSVIIHKEPQNN